MPDANLSSMPGNLTSLVIVSPIETQLKLVEMIPVLVEAGRSTKNVAVEIYKKEEFDEFQKQRPPTYGLKREVRLKQWVQTYQGNNIIKGYRKGA